jgi:hypothetical protein
MPAITIHACRKWNQTGIRLDAGKTYVFRASGTWKDWNINSGPEGYTRGYLKPFERLRRMPEANWFSVIGTYDGDPAARFDIGHLVSKNAGRYTATRSGELWCYANDLPWMHWNNSGEIELEVVEETS